MPIVDEDALITPDPKQIIWRYMDLEKFESTLREGSLFFCRSDKFSDPFEGTIPKKEVDYRVKAQKQVAIFFERKITHDEAVEKSKQIGRLHQRFRRAYIVNCWHMNDGESDAMWRLYLKTNEGVAIQTTVEGLYKSFEDFDEQVFISKVRYLDYERDIWFDRTEYPLTSYNLFTPIIHKRKAFAHESELRIFQQIENAVNNDEYWKNEPNYMGRLVPCNIKLLIDKIILPPTSDDSVKRKVEKMLKKYGFKVGIEKSKLNDEPYF